MALGETLMFFCTVSEYVLLSQTKVLIRCSADRSVKLND